MSADRAATTSKRLAVSLAGWYLFYLTAAIGLKVYAEQRGEPVPLFGSLSWTEVALGPAFAVLISLAASRLASRIEAWLKSREAS